jgi:hypothetical protein
MGGLLSPLGDVLLGQDLAQPGMLVIHIPFPSLQLRLLVPAAGSSMVVAGQLRMALRRRLRIRHVPYAGALPLPIFGR